MANFTWFTTFPIFCHQSVSFLLKSQKFSFQGGVHRQFVLSFSTFLNCFTPKQLKMTHNGEFCQKSGLGLAKTGQFWSLSMFSIFSSKMRLRLTQNGQFYLIHNFSYLLPPKHLIFGEIAKIFVPRGGGTSANFFEFFNFFELFHHQSSSKWSTMANFTWFTTFPIFCYQSDSDCLKKGNFG